MGEERRTKERKAKMYSDSREVLWAQPLQTPTEKDTCLDKWGTAGNYNVLSTNLKWAENTPELMGARPKWTQEVNSYSPLSYHGEIPCFNNVKTYDLLLKLDDDKQDQKIKEAMLNNKPVLLEELDVMNSSLDKVEKREVDDKRHNQTCEFYI